VTATTRTPTAVGAALRQRDLAQKTQLPTHNLEVHTS
jgi:hypothetical protein